jgi:hypothetical protein
MSPEFWLGLAGLGVTIGGWLLIHVIRDHETQSNLKARVARIEQDIGTSDTGMRGQIHENTNMLSRLRAVVYFVARKMNLEIMKDLDDK